MFDIPPVALHGLWATLYPAMVWLYGLLNAISAVCLIVLFARRLTHSEGWFRVAVLCMVVACLGNVGAVLIQVGFTVSATNMGMVMGLAGVSFGMASRTVPMAHNRRMERVKDHARMRQRV